MRSRVLVCENESETVREKSIATDSAPSPIDQLVLGHECDVVVDVKVVVVEAVVVVTGVDRRRWRRRCSAAVVADTAADAVASAWVSACVQCALQECWCWGVFELVQCIVHNWGVARARVQWGPRGRHHTRDVRIAAGTADGPAVGRAWAGPPPRHPPYSPCRSIQGYSLKTDTTCLKPSGYTYTL